MSTYIHGTSDTEQTRLSQMNDFMNQACLKELRLKGGEKVLDVGSGLGQFSRMMAGVAGQQRQVIGIERDLTQLAGAKSLAKQAGQADVVEFRHGDALDFPLSTEEWGTFDVVHTRFLLEHLPTPEKVVEQMVKAAKPGGRIVLADDDHDIFRIAPEAPGFYTLWQAYMRSFDRLGCDPYIGRRLTSLLHEAGAQPVYNNFVFFGSCQGSPTFDFISNNMIGVVLGAKLHILKEKLLDEATFDWCVANFRKWQQLPDAAMWYAVCWAEGRKL